MKFNSHLTALNKIIDKPVFTVCIFENEKEAKERKKNEFFFRIGEEKKKKRRKITMGNEKNYLTIDFQITKRASRI